MVVNVNFRLLQPVQIFIDQTAGLVGGAKSAHVPERRDIHQPRLAVYQGFHKSGFPLVTN